MTTPECRICVNLRNRADGVRIRMSPREIAGVFRFNASTRLTNHRGEALSVSSVVVLH